MTLKIELSDAVIADATDTYMYTGNMLMALTAALEAMVKEGTACFAPCEINSDEDGDFWNANEGWKTGDFPALIIRLGGKP